MISLIFNELFHDNENYISQTRKKPRKSAIFHIKIARCSQNVGVV